MATPDLPEGHSPDHSDEGNGSDKQTPDRSRLERILTKSVLWKKQTLRNIEAKRSMAETDSSDVDDTTARLLHRLSAQLEERNDEIRRLQQAVSKLENEKSKLDRAQRRQVARHRKELERMQVAYDQFERESDMLLTELGQKNERLRNECRFQSLRPLFKY